MEITRIAEFREVAMTVAMEFKSRLNDDWVQVLILAEHIAQWLINGHIPKGPGFEAWHGEPDGSGKPALKSVA